MDNLKLAISLIIPSLFILGTAALVDYLWRRRAEKDQNNN